MQSNVLNLWWPRGVTFFLYALVALSASFWALKGTGAAAHPAAIPAATGAATTAPDPQIVALALGGGRQVAAPEAASASSRYVLVGVVADQSKGGAALIAVDGKPAKAFRVGATVDGSLVLAAVAGRRATLAPDRQSPPTLTLELPATAK
jgi:general secretion pathway protein C